MIRLIVVIVMCLLCANVRGQPSRPTDALAREFFYGHGVYERMRLLPTYPLSVQLDLFIFGNQKIHPPATYLASCFAVSGAEGAELLRGKLAKPGSDLDTRDIALLLESMQALHTFDVLADSQLLSLLKHRVAAMKDRGWQDTAQGMVAHIESGFSSGRSASSLCAPVMTHPPQATSVPTTPSVIMEAGRHANAEYVAALQDPLSGLTWLATAESPSR